MNESPSLMNTLASVWVDSEYPCATLWYLLLQLGLAGALAKVTLGVPRSVEQAAFEEHMRKQAWEQGSIDYLGRDSFDNIWRKITETLAQAPPKPQLQKPATGGSPAVWKHHCFYYHYYCYYYNYYYYFFFWYFWMHPHLIILLLETHSVNALL